MKFKQNSFYLTPLYVAKINKNKEIVQLIENACNLNKIYIDVPFVENEIVKEKGAKFDGTVKKWYYTNPNQNEEFKQWKMKSLLKLEDLTKEQIDLVEIARKRKKNVLVDSCIGSGKTTTIQVLCNELKERKILYFTYNRLLKFDAKTVVVNGYVTNYHSFAIKCLKQFDNSIIIEEPLEQFLSLKNNMEIGDYDLLILDEYQDIDQEISQLLDFVKEKNPNIQIIAVGNMNQKFYDVSPIDLNKFIKHFLGEDYEELKFSKCFRLNDYYARQIGEIYNETIRGENNNCEVEVMNINDVVEFLNNEVNLSDLLCVGSLGGAISSYLEPSKVDAKSKSSNSNYTSNFSKPKVTLDSSKFNDHTKCTNNSNNDEFDSKNINDLAIFTTYDSCKGLERKICVVFDFEVEIWEKRLNKTYSRYDLLRNIFCGAACRGKERIIFVRNNYNSLILNDLKILAKQPPTNNTKNVIVPEIFYHKYKSYLINCLNSLEINIDGDNNPNVEKFYINLYLYSWCNSVGVCCYPLKEIMMKSKYFEKYKVKTEINLYRTLNNSFIPLNIDFTDNHEDNIQPCKDYCIVAACKTHDVKYLNAPNINFFDDERKFDMKLLEKNKIPRNQDVQKKCSLSLHNKEIQVNCHGLCDIIIANDVYQIKYTKKITYIDILECAFYMIATKKKKGIILNVLNNEKITIVDKGSFSNELTKLVTEGNSMTTEFFNSLNYKDLKNKK